MIAIDKYSHSRKICPMKNDKNNPSKVNQQNKFKLPNIFDKKNFKICIEKCSLLQINKPDYAYTKEIIEKIPEKCIVIFSSKNLLEKIIMEMILVMPKKIIRKKRRNLQKKNFTISRKSTQMRN